MPRRSNKFQRLILLLNSCFGAGSRVTESAMLSDKVTGEPREVDILIQATTASYDVNIAIEVVGRRRKADTPWVESMHSKHATLPTDKLVLVAEAGFTKQALVKAKFYGIESITLESALDADWDLVANLTATGFFKLITFTYSCAVIYVPLGGGERKRLEVSPSASFSEGDKVVSLDKFVKNVLYLPLVKDVLYPRILSMDERQFWFSYSIPNVCTMRLADEMMSVTELWVGLEVDCSITPIEYASGIYRGTPFVGGTSTEPTNDLGGVVN